MNSRTGPLAGVRVVEFTGIGPAPHGVMLLSDFGAEVLRIDRPNGAQFPNAALDRGRHSIRLDLRSDAGRERALEAIARADVLVEGYRPGVMERLGLGPDVALDVNPGLIYGRMTGWGQSGSLAKAAGHDLNYIAITGALAAIVDAEGYPIPPLNLVGDIGGGSLYLAFGIVSALLERERSGKGQIVDAAIVDGVASMMAMFWGMRPERSDPLDPGVNIISGHAPFYRCYLCNDGRYISVGAIEPQFYEELVNRIDAPPSLRRRGADDSDWADQRDAFAALFKTRSRDEWCAILEGTDACFAPVLTLEESRAHAHMAERGIYVSANGIEQPGPTPRLSRTPGEIGPDGDGEALLRSWSARKA